MSPDMIPLTQHSLDKLESILKGFGYKVRYEKGSFKTGACVLQHAKVVVVNKFSNVEVKVQSLFQLVLELQGEESLLDDKLKTFYQSIKQTKLSI